MTATTEPTRLTAGDTIAWTKSLTEYPATGGWTLVYRLINAAGHIDIAGTASGSDHAIAVSASDSAAWPPGDYAWQSYVENGAVRHTVGKGRLTIDPNFAAQADGYDDRSIARKILDGLLAAYQSATLSKSFVQEYEIAGRKIKFAAKTDWLAEINFWKAEVAKEENAARRSAGKGLGTRIYERF